MATKDDIKGIIDAIANRLKEKAIKNRQGQALKILKKIRRDQESFEYPHCIILNPNFRRDTRTVGKYLYALDIPLVIMDISYDEDIDLEGFRNMVFDINDTINDMQKDSLGGRVDRIGVSEGAYDTALMTTPSGEFLLYFGLTVRGEFTRTET